MWAPPFNPCVYNVPFLFRALLFSRPITTTMASEFTSEMQALTEQLEHLETTQDKMDAVTSFLQHSASRGGLRNVTLKPGGQLEFGHMQDDEDQESLTALLNNHGLTDAYLEWLMENAGEIEGLGDDETLERLPCANVEPDKNWRCTEGGMMACGKCRLVSYCSKVGLRG